MLFTVQSFVFSVLFNILVSFDRNGDHIHTNFRDLYTHLRKAGYFIEVLGLYSVYKIFLIFIIYHHILTVDWFTSANSVCYLIVICA